MKKKLIRYLKCKFSSVCNSGTSAIHLSFLAINLKKDDVVIMPAINFTSSFNIAKTIGAKIFLADVNKHTGQMHQNMWKNVVKNLILKKLKLSL